MGHPFLKIDINIYRWVPLAKPTHPTSPL